MTASKSTRRVANVAAATKPLVKRRLTSLFPKTKTVGDWINVYDDDGKVIRQIAKPFGKTSVPLSQIRKAVRKVIRERAEREVIEDK